MHYLALVVGTALTLITGWCVAALVESILEKVLATLVVSVTQIVLTLMFAGYVLESFSTATVLVVNLVVTGAALAITARATSLGDRLRGSWTTARGVRVGGNLVRNAWAWVLGVFVAVEAVYLSLVAYVLPPATWDSLTYHLVAVAEWIRADRFVKSPLSLLANTDPLNGDLTFLWVGALTRSDLLVDLPQLGFAALGAVAVVAMARTVGVSRPGSIVAGCLYFLTPIVLAQATASYVDLVLPGLFLAGYAFLLRFVLAEEAPPRPVTTLVLAGIACGLAAGSKSIGVIYAVVAVVVLGANLLWRHRRHGLSWRRAGAWIAAFVLPVIAFGSFWYVRTWIDYGSPTHPYQVAYAGIEVFGGTPLAEVNQPPPAIKRVPAGPLRTLASWAQLTRVTVYDQRYGGLGPQWLLLELPALVAFSVYCAMHRRRILLTFVLPFVVMLAATPSSWWSRFTIAFVAPGAVAVPFMIERIRKRTVVALLHGATIVLVVVGCVMSARRATTPNHTFSPQTILARATDPASERTIGRLVLPEYAWADAIPPNSRVAVYRHDVTNRFYYALFGADFRNDVVALSDKEVKPTSLLPTLRRRAIDYLVTYPGTDNSNIAQGNPDALERLSSVNDVDLYRLNR